jgi:hypothetical protein
MSAAKRLLRRAGALTGLANREMLAWADMADLLHDEIPLGLTFDDVLLQPLESGVLPSGPTPAAT